MFDKLFNRKQQKVLIYCGVHDCEALNGLIGKFDVVYGFDANIHKIENAKEKYKDRENVHFFHGALTDKDGDEIEFKITKNWDASSSIGTLNPDFPSYADPKSPLHDTPVESVKVKTISLINFCKKHNIKFIDTLITDLQGMDFTVLKTMQPMIESGRIGHIRCEVEKDEKPQIYEGLPPNKRSQFDELLKNYEVTKVEGEEEWWECDMEWKLKGLVEKE